MKPLIMTTFKAKKIILLLNLVFAILVICTEVKAQSNKTYQVQDTVLAMQKIEAAAQLLNTGKTEEAIINLSAPLLLVGIDWDWGYE